MTNKHKITYTKKKIVDGVHTVDLSHNKDKTEWFVTIKGEFYTEFTFKSIGAANDMYILCIGSTNIFMDSLVVNTTKPIGPQNIPFKSVKATSPEAIEYKQKSQSYRMADAK